MKSNCQFPISTISFFLSFSITDYLAFMFLRGNFLLIFICNTILLRLLQKSNFATSQIAQTTLRSILGQSQLDELLSNREEVNAELQKVIDFQTAPWGIKV